MKVLKYIVGYRKNIKIIVMSTSVLEYDHSGNRHYVKTEGQVNDRKKVK